jgi:5-methylcytosine-specific restriction endonuclease McrA
MTYTEQLKRPLWLEKREEILKRDNYKCCVCGRKGGLEVHHLYYEHNKLAHQYDNESLVTLCPRCHDEAHGYVQKVSTLIAFHMFKKGKELTSLVNILNSI